MPTRTLVVVSLKPTSGIEEDAAQSSFLLSGEKGPFLGNTLDFTGPINTFYNAIGSIISHKMSRAALGIRYSLYDVTTKLDGSSHGSPVAIDAGTLLTGAAINKTLPEEVALVLTLRGIGWEGQPVEAPDGADPDFAIDRPRQRATGRLYIGPLDIRIQDLEGNRPRPEDTLMIRNAAADMQASFQAQPVPLAWSVWSRKSAAVRRVVQVETDDAFDTQRRRGVSALARTVKTLP